MQKQKSSALLSLSGVSSITMIWNLLENLLIGQASSDVLTLNR